MIKKVVFNEKNGPVPRFPVILPANDSTISYTNMHQQDDKQKQEIIPVTDSRPGIENAERRFPEIIVRLGKNISIAGRSRKVGVVIESLLYAESIKIDQVATQVQDPADRKNIQNRTGQFSRFRRNTVNQIEINEYSKDKRHVLRLE